MMVRAFTENLGRRVVGGVEEFGYGAALLAESLFWIAVGALRQQPVRIAAVAAEMMRVGVSAIPVVTILAFANGVMMALQGIYTLRDFGAESQVIPGLAMSITREFGALIVGIVVAGRSGSAIAARIGAMQMSQEIDALRVLGVNPVRHLVAPILLAMVIMVPALTILANVVALLGGGLLCSLQMHMSLAASPS
jgi:phospholipid/cholesterol/gamma-HCH transport system permease protein